MSIYICCHFRATISCTSMMVICLGEHILTISWRAIENTSCSHRLLLPSELSRQTSRRYGVPLFVCVPHTVAKTLQAGSSAAFEASSCQQFQPLHLPSSAQWFFIIEGCRRRYCLFWFFQLEDIVDFPLIHRPYGFIAQFLMINTGNGGSFVQL